MQGSICLATGQILPLSAAVTPVQSPVTVKFNQFQLGSNDLPLTEAPLARNSGPNDPEQIHITLGGDTLHATLHASEESCTRTPLTALLLQLCTVI